MTVDVLHAMAILIENKINTLYVLFPFNNDTNYTFKYTM